jgi:S1-C subfamily serine protease
MLSAGAAAGVVITGRMSATQPGYASPPPQVEAQSRSAIAAASGGLPDLSGIAERAIQASVNISSTRTIRQRTDPLTAFWYGLDPRGYTTRQAQSLGSGVIVSADGYVLTNSHVVQSRNAQVKVTLADNRELDATIVGVDELTDLAVVKIQATGLAPLPWADSTRVRVAEWVLAVGNPFAFSQTVTLGIVSAVNRHNPQLATYNDMIQTDAAINPGNSGGALVNARGELVGINTMIYSETGGYQGIGFAIPANLAQTVMTSLIKTGEVVHGSIGLYTLRTITPDMAEQAGLGRIHGVLVYDMFQNGPADRVGIQVNDIIVRFNGTDIVDDGQLNQLIANAAPGSTVTIEVNRRGRMASFKVPVEKMQTLPRGRQG